MQLINICTLRSSDGFSWKVYVRDHHIIQQTDIKLQTVNVIYKEVKPVFMEPQKKDMFSSRPLNVEIHMSFSVSSIYQKYGKNSKANLRDLIAATGLIILFKSVSNYWIFSPLDPKIWWMTLKNNRAPILYYVKLWSSFQIHRWIQTWVTVR